jgi:IS30 family transposase
MKVSNTSKEELIMSHYNHLNILERENILCYFTMGLSMGMIGQKIGRNKSTVSRELKRNWNDSGYSPSMAQSKYERRRAVCGRKSILSDETTIKKIRVLIQEKKWSPEQIERRLKFENNPLKISYTTIYRAIDKGVLTRLEDGALGQRGFKIYLRHKGKPRVKKGTETRGKITISNELSDRPKGATERTRIGDWEADTVLGKQNSSCLVTLVDRMTRMTLCAKVSGKRKAPVAEAMIKMLSTLPPKWVQTITPDRGKEFAAHPEVTTALDGVQFYFPPPHQPWQRGTNENTNGLLRELSPKGYDMDKLSETQIQLFCYNLNHRPRKCLNWRTPYEALTGDVLHLT